jgi:hypothetical protein
MATAADLDPNDPINILLRPFDPIPKAAAAASSDGADSTAQAQADAQASQAAQDAAAAAAAAAAAEAEKQRQLNLIRQQTTGTGTTTIFGGAEGEVLYESNVRPSARRWESSNRVEVKKSVFDYKMSEPIAPEPEEVVAVATATVVNAAAPSVLSAAPPAASPVSFSIPIRVASTPPPVAAAAAKPPPSPSPAAKKAVPVQAVAAPAVFSPTAGVHPTQDRSGDNKTEELKKKVHGGGAKVRQCPSFRMLEFQLQYDEYKETKTAVS